MGRRSRVLILPFAALLGAAPAFAQLRAARLPARVPPAALGMAGVAPGAQTTALPSVAAPALTLPSPVLPAPYPAAFASAPQSATPAAIPAAAAPQAEARAPATLQAAAALSRPTKKGNGFNRTTFAEILKSLRENSSPPAASQPTTEVAGRSARLFDGAAFAEAVLTQTGTALRNTLRAKLSMDHSHLSYAAARAKMFSSVDNILVGGNRGVVDAYSGIFIEGQHEEPWEYTTLAKYGKPFPEPLKLSVEHLWPQSYFSHLLPMLSDLHCLLPVFSDPNERRNVLPFDEVPEGKAVYRNGFGARMGARSFEPPDSAKGQIARALLYFFVRYGDGDILPAGLTTYFWNSRIQTYLRWNRRFPPKQAELDRNDRIEKFQGNRNPFVDDPALAERIGLEGFRL